MQVRKGDIIKLIEGQQGSRDAQEGDPFGWRDLIYNGLVECVAFCPPCSLAHMRPGCPSRCCLTVSNCIFQKS